MCIWRRDYVGESQTLDLNFGLPSRALSVCATTMSARQAETPLRRRTGQVGRPVTGPRRTSGPLSSLVLNGLVREPNREQGRFPHFGNLPVAPRKSPNRGMRRAASRSSPPPATFWRCLSRALVDSPELTSRLRDDVYPRPCRFSPSDPSSRLAKAAPPQARARATTRRLKGGEISQIL